MSTNTFSFVETPSGILTQNDVLFRTTEEALHAYAGPVIREVGLETLLERASRWVRAPRTLGMIAFLGGVLLLPVWGALLLGIGVFLVVELLVAPLFPLKSLILVFRLLEGYWSEFVGAAIVFGWIGFRGDISEALLGLGLFLFLRWGLFRWIETLMKRSEVRFFYRLPLADQVLRTVILRSAVSLRVDLPELQGLEKSARAAWRGL